MFLGQKEIKVPKIRIAFLRMITATIYEFMMDRTVLARFQVFTKPDGI